jgi:hypothetical protein
MRDRIIAIPQEVLGTEYSVLGTQYWVLNYMSACPVILFLYIHEPKRKVKENKALIGSHSPGPSAYLLPRHPSIIAEPVG